MIKVTISLEVEDCYDAEDGSDDRNSLAVAINSVRFAIAGQADWPAEVVIIKAVTQNGNRAEECIRAEY